MCSINDEQQMQAGLNGIIPKLILQQTNSQLSSGPVFKDRKISIQDLGQKTLSEMSLEEQKASESVYKNNRSIGAAFNAASSKVGNSGLGSFMNKNTGLAGAISGGLKTAGELIHKNRTGLQKTDEGALKIRDAQYSVLKKIPITAPFAAAAEVLDNALGAITDGLGSATKADKVLTALPLLGNTAAIFAGKTDTFKGDISEINTGDFGGVVSDSMRAQDLSGVKSVQAKKLNKQIRSAQADFNKADDLIDYNTFRKNHNIGQELMSSVLGKYQGNQQIVLSKKGTKFPELDTVRAILESSKVKSFKSGGKIEKENIIPTGALHKNLHHIDDIGIDITKKGIPVVTMDEGGEFKEQIAEVEAAEWTLSLDVTKQIEEYWNNYKGSGDDNIAIECGKYLVDQMFNNTRDDDKVIKKTE